MSKDNEGSFSLGSFLSGFGSAGSEPLPTAPSSSSTNTILPSSTSHSMLDTLSGDANPSSSSASQSMWDSLPSFSWGSLPSFSLSSSTETRTITSSSAVQEGVPAGAVSSVNGQQPEAVTTTTTETITISSIMPSNTVIAVSTAAAALVAAPISVPVAASVAALGAAASAFNYFVGESSTTTRTTTVNDPHQALLQEIREWKWKAKNSSEDSSENHEVSAAVFHFGNTLDKLQGESGDTAILGNTPKD